MYEVTKIINVYKNQTLNNKESMKYVFGHDLKCPICNKDLVFTLDYSTCVCKDIDCYFNKKY